MKKQKIVEAMAKVLEEEYGWEIRKENRYHCPNCAMILYTAKFCPECGTKTERI